MPRHSNSSRPTVRAVAAAAGVSAMTVSLALRNNPRIPAETRERVQRFAAELGYRPDPEVSKLMHHLRTRRKPGYQATLAVFTTLPEGGDTPYFKEMLTGVRQRAEELGYNCSLFRLENVAEPQPALQRILRSRGIEGLLLMPLTTPSDISKLVNWSEFSVVSATHAVLAPEFHRVVPRQVGNVLLICEELSRRGYRRIGLVQSEKQDIRVNHGFSAAVCWQNLLGGTELVHPLIHPGDFPTEVKSWFERERPDVIITCGDVIGRKIANDLGLALPGPVGFVATTKAGRSIFAGIDELPAEIGARAVEQLTGMIHRGEKGIPATPTITMIRGHWISGATVRRQTARKTISTTGADK